jgi:L-malate glycosyltransferase
MVGGIPKRAVVNYLASTPLKICHITSGDLLAGKEVLLLNLAKASLKEALDRTLFVLFNNGGLSKKLREQGARVVVFQESGIAADWQIIFKLARLLKEEMVQVVHTHGYKGNVIGGMASRLSGRPLLVRTEHGKPPPILKHGLAPASWFALLDYFMGVCWTDKIIAVSSDLAKLLNRRYPAEKIITIYNGLYISPSGGRQPLKNLKQEFGIGEENKLIGIFARLNPEKGLGLFLKSARLVTSKAPQVRFFIVGDGPLYGELKGETRRLDLQEQVYFTGFREDAVELLCQMDVVVLSSFHEGMPMVLLEAMALRKPIVATKVGGVPEVIDDRKTGLLVPAGDEYSLAMACLELLDNPIYAAQLGNDARTQVEKRFSAQDMVNKLLSLYLEGLQKKKRP